MENKFTRCCVCGRRFVVADSWKKDRLSHVNVAGFGKRYVCDTCKQLGRIEVLQWFFEAEEKEIDTLFEQGADQVMS